MLPSFEQNTRHEKKIHVSCQQKEKKPTVDSGKKAQDRSRLNSDNIPEMARRTPNEITKGRFALYASSSTFAARTLLPMRGTGLCGSDEHFLFEFGNVTHK